MKYNQKFLKFSTGTKGVFLASKFYNKYTNINQYRKKRFRHGTNWQTNSLLAKYIEPIIKNNFLLSSISKYTFKTFNKILVVTDGSGSANKVAFHAVNIAKAAGDELYAFYVISTNIR